MEKTALRPIVSLYKFRGVPETDAAVDLSFHTVLSRLSTLCDFSPSINISLIHIANAGFYKLTHGEGKTTKCYSCGVVYDKWKSGDDPMAIHKMLNSSCPILTGFDTVSNVPLPIIGAAGRIITARNKAACPSQHLQNNSYSKNVSTSTDNNQQHARISSSSNSNGAKNIAASPKEVGNRQELLQTVAGRSVIAGQGEQSTDFETLRVFVDNPKYPNYAKIEARISSYKGWSSYLHPTAQQMSEAGFLYAGYKDHTRCFSCGGGLKYWEAGDDPWMEHAKWFPECSYLRQIKGDKLQTFVHKKHQEHRDQQKYPASKNATNSTNNSQEPLGDSQYKSRLNDYSNRKSNLATSSNNNSGANNITVGQAEVGNRQELLQTVAGRSVLEMGYKDGEILVALDKIQRFGKGRDEIEVRSSSATVETSTNTTSRRSSAENGAASCLDNTELLLEENRKLKDQRLCKICLDLEATIAFLPCGHIVCCKDCAPAMRKCPVCRTHVKSNVKTYLV